MIPDQDNDILNEEAELPFYVITIGASAGGLEPIRQFFRQVPPEYPHAIVVIQHFSDDHKSMMPELLASETSMPIQEVTDGLDLRGGQIYLIPPSHNIQLQHEDYDKYAFSLSSRAERPLVNLPIDLFLESVADIAGNKAIAVILSGAGGDGTHGVRLIKARGGLVMVQDPQTADFDSMPNSAINTNQADFVLAPHQMPEEISRYIEGLDSGWDWLAVHLQKHPDIFKRIVRKAEEVGKTSFSSYKEPMLKRRIAKRMVASGCQSLDDYEALLDESFDEIERLSQDFLIGVTCFFRDRLAWEAIRLRIIPTLFRQGKQQLKIWTAGCCTGEEAYTLAILLDEYMSENDIDCQISIFATDIDENSLAFAQRGVYSLSIGEHISKNRLERYFNYCSNGYEVNSVLKKMVIFSKHDLVSSPPFINVDMLICRNVLIYMNNDLQDQLLTKFSFSLVRDGTLFLGPSESVGKQVVRFNALDKSWRIFKNRKMPISGNLLKSQFVAPESVIPSSSKVTTNQASTDIYRDSMLKGMLNKYDVCALVIDEIFNILDSCGPYKKYLMLPDEGFSNDLLKMVPENIATTLSLCLRKVQKNKQHEEATVEYLRGEEKFSLEIAIYPLDQNMPESAQRYIVVISPEMGSAEEGHTHDKTNIDGKSQQYIKQIEQELDNTKKFLHATIEDLQASNAELQNTNQELFSSNEELQSTYEEMQSVNEELHTLNAEYQLKNNELQSLNADMVNLLNSTEVAVLFIDDENNIRKFTPAIKNFFHLRESDIGRPISHFMPNLNADAAKWLTDCMEREIVEREKYVTQDAHYNWFMITVTPFLDDGEIKGKIIYFLDVKELTQTKQELEDKRIALENVLEGTLAGYWDWYIQENREYMSPTFKSMFGYEDHEMENTPEAWKAIVHPDDLKNIMDVFDKHVSSRGEVPYDNEIRYYHKNGSIVWVWCRGKVIEWDQDGKPVRMVGSHVDITALKEAQEALIQHNQEARELSYITAHDLQEPLNTIRNFLHMLKKQGDLELNETQSSLFNHIETASERLSHLIRDLLSYSRLSHDNQEIESVNLSEVVSEIRDDFHAKLSECNGKIEIKDLPEIHANRTHIRLLFQSLISNSIKFRSKDNAPEICIFSDENAGDLRIHFRDNGVGIEEQHYKKIFKIFERLYTQSEYGGTGIGLAMCKKIADLYGGHIEVQSEVNKGSLFTLKLPKHKVLKS